MMSKEPRTELLTKREAEWVARACDENVPREPDAGRVGSYFREDLAKADSAPTDLDAVEAALGPEPEVVEGKVLREGWYVMGNGSSGWFCSPNSEGAIYVKLIEVPAPSEEEQPTPEDRTRAAANARRCAEVTEEV
jgi:hypothetical protein